jgi:peptide/nickel transport system substrate-binding protein/glutathione transport system substrate-binding protein
MHNLRREKKMNRHIALNVLKFPVVVILALSLLLSGCQPTPAVTQPTVAVQATVAGATQATSVTTEQATSATTEQATVAPTVTPKYGGILKYALSDEPQGWFPHNTQSCQNMTVFEQVYSSLLRYDQNDQIVGDLAQSWEWPDSKTVIFHLRPDVKWHNGDTLTADQVVKSMDHLLDPKVSVNAENLLKTIDHFEVVDNLTVKLVLKQTDVGILRSLTSTPGQAFILYTNYDEATAGQSPATAIGTGPFMFESYEPGVSLKLVRNPNYFIKGMPYLDGIEFDIIKDTEAGKTALLAGDVDMAESIDFNSLASLKANPKIILAEGTGFYGCRLLLDRSVYPTDDVNVRKALNFAIDRQMIVNSVLAGQGAPIWGGMIPPGRFGYAPALANTYSYDPQKAKQLLAADGWTDSNGDGWVDKDGKPMILSFITYGPDWWSQAAEVVQANLKDIGVQVTLKVDDWATYKTERVAIQNLPVGTPGPYNILGGTIWGLDLVDMMQYHVTGGSYNFTRVSIPALDALYLQARATVDDAQREALLQQAQAMELDLALDIAPVWINRGEAYQSYVKNFYHMNEDGCWGTLLWQAWLDK